MDYKWCLKSSDETRIKHPLIQRDSFPAQRVIRVCNLRLTETWDFNIVIKEAVVNNNKLKNVNNPK